MLVNLSKELKTGDNFPLTLTFEKAGDVQLNVQVKEN